MSNAETSPVRSAFLTVSMRWLDRLIGITSTLVLARLLLPDDFGIVAMATIVIGIAETLFAVGVHIPLIQNAHATPAHYNSAWTLRLIQTWTVAVGVLVLAPYGAEFFSEPRLTPVLRVLALVFILEGLENIWIISFQKEMRFQKDFNFLLSKRICSFLITIALAVLMQSYWALIFGNVLGRVFGTALSYYVHPNRPTFCTRHIREIFNVSMWMMVKSAGDYLNASLSNIVVGHRTPTATLGTFSLSSQIATMPSTELISPVNRVLFPMFSRAAHSQEELRRLYMLAQGLQMLLAIPACAGLSLVAKEFVPVVLGKNWLPAIPFIQWMAILGVVQTVYSSGSFILITLGKLRWLAFFGWGRVIVFSALALWLFPSDDALTIVQQRITSALTVLLVYLAVLLRVFKPLRLSDIVYSLYRPLIGVAAMTAAISTLDQIVLLPMWAMLMAKVTLGAAVYAAVVMVLWVAGGSKAGAERYLMDLALKALGGRKNDTLS